MTTSRLYRNLRPTTLAAIVADLQDGYANTGDPAQDWMAAEALAALVSNAGENDAAVLVAQAAEAL